MDGWVSRLISILLFKNNDWLNYENRGLRENLLVQRTIVHSDNDANGIGWAHSWSQRIMKELFVTYDCIIMLHIAS